MLETLKQSSLFGNTYYDYAFAAGVALLGFLAVWIIKTIVLSQLHKLSQKTKTTIDDTLIDLTSTFLVPLAYFLVLFASAHTLETSPGFDKSLKILVALVLTFFGARFIMAVVQFLVFDVYIPKKPDNLSLETQFKGMMPAIATLVYGGGLIFLLDNLGFNISALVAGLGIGGVAVALAASAVLGDLFAYVAIMFDKPFVLGDFLIIDGYLGSVEHIGIKTTRLRSLGGEQLIFSNKDLTDSRLRNYKRMSERRIVFKLGVTYDTTLEKIKEIPGIVRKIIEDNTEARFDRAHFSKYGDFNLEIEAVYYVLTGDYNKYMDVQQEINFKIKEEFEKRKIEFAFPTQTLYLNKTNA